MNLIHTSYFKSKYKNNVKKLYLNAFCKSERFPFYILKKCSKQKNVIFNTILDDNNFVGFEYIINCEDAVYLMYLAIDENKRGKKYGSNILKELIKKYKTVFLSIERANNDINKYRKKFYLENGFFETNKFYEDKGIEYEVLCTNKDYDINKEKLEKRYVNMASSKIIKYVIIKMFNVYNISFIE